MSWWFEFTFGSIYHESGYQLIWLLFIWIKSLTLIGWNRSGGGGGGTNAKDALGNDVVAAEWLKTHGPGDRTLTQGLKVCLVHMCP